MQESMKKALPEDAFENCEVCKGKTKHKLKEECSHYYIQMQTSYLVAVDVFCEVVASNKHMLFSNRRVLQELTIKFFNSFVFLKGEAVLLFDIDKIIKHCLYAGFVSLSQQFANSEPLQNLKVINKTLKELEDEELENELYEKEDKSFISIQKKFFKKEEQYYKNEQYIKER